MRLHRTGCRSSPRKVTLGSAARLQAPSLTPRCRYQLFAVEGHCSLGIYFVTLTQTCGAHFAHRRFFFLLKFCARAYSGYLFRQRFPAAGCRVQVANFMLMRFAIFLARAYSLHRFCYSNLASHIVWCLFFVECTSRLQTSSYGARFLVHRKNQPARKPPGFPYPPPRAPAPTAVFYPGFSPRPGRLPQGPRWRSISASASQPPGRSPYTWQSARG